MVEALARTPLHDEHVDLGARMVPFAGFEMPVHYASGIVAEHRAVREAAGLFDVSHMGELEIRGPDALRLVQRVTTNDAASLAVGQAQYSVLCQEDGGALDDCLVYRLSDRFMIVVNASTRERDRAWIAGHVGSLDAELVDRSDDTALLALQGPRAQEVLGAVTEHPLQEIAYYHFGEVEVAARSALVSRTGYTGEDGFELYVAPESAGHIWRALLDAGTELGILPAGLGARDSLRLEMGYVLYGSDLDTAHTPLEAGLGWVVKLDKGEFVGRTALARQKQAGIVRKLAGFRLRERGFPRQGYAVHQQRTVIGTVTSGVLSPTLGTGIGLAYLPRDAAAAGTPIEIMIRGKAVAAEVVRPPFYTAGSIRR
ncbi:MAG: glycine cleavage system aminomethyltransferase GcvT [Longimicrobiales bacterium]